MFFVEAVLQAMPGLYLAWVASPSDNELLCSTWANLIATARIAYLQPECDLWEHSRHTLNDTRGWGWQSIARLQGEGQSLILAEPCEGCNAPASMGGHRHPFLNEREAPTWGLKAGYRFPSLSQGSDKQTVSLKAIETLRFAQGDRPRFESAERVVIDREQNLF